MNYNLLKSLYKITEDIYEQAKSINSDMNKNDLELLQTFQVLIEKRADVIKELDQQIECNLINWSEEEQTLIEKIRALQNRIQPLMIHLHHSFSTQIIQLNQRKHLAKKYVNAYKNSSTDGAFIDQRK